MSATESTPSPVVTGCGTVPTAQVFDWLLGTLPLCARAGWVPKLATMPLSWLEPLHERHEVTVGRFAGAATNVIIALQAVEARRVRDEQNAVQRQRKIGAALRDGRTLPGLLVPVNARAMLDPAWGAFAGLCEQTETLIEKIADTLRAERREADHETADAMLALADVIDRVVSRDEARHATGAMKARLARASRNIDWLRQESDKISSRRVAGGVR
jgi:hypothetical protein